MKLQLPIDILLLAWDIVALTCHTIFHSSLTYVFCKGFAPATLLKPLVPSSVRVTESFVPLSTEKDVASSDHNGI